MTITFICTGKPKNSCDLLYCDIHFIAVVWNRTHSIPEVCLHSLSCNSNVHGERGPPLKVLKQLQISGSLPWLDIRITWVCLSPTLRTSGTTALWWGQGTRVCKSSPGVHLWLRSRALAHETSSLTTRGSLGRRVVSASALQRTCGEQPLEGGEKTAQKEKKSGLQQTNTNLGLEVYGTSLYQLLCPRNYLWPEFLLQYCAIPAPVICLLS